MNFMLQTLHFIFCILTCFCGFFVAFSNNAISSVVFLILVFCNAAILLFMFNIDFLGLILIIIYVGAVAVLFLFVIMMLPIKREIKRFNVNILLMTFLIFILVLSSFIKSNSVIDFKFFTEYSSFFFDNLTAINSLGQVLYGPYIICFLIAGIILLVSLIGSITLTLKFEHSQKSQLSFRQLSKSNNLLVNIN